MTHLPDNAIIEQTWVTIHGLRHYRPRVQYKVNGTGFAGILAGPICESRLEADDWIDLKFKELLLGEYS